MFKGMNVNKRMNAVTGLAVFGGKWGILSHPTVAGLTAAPDLVRLGPAGTEYHLAHDGAAILQQKFTGLLSAASEFQVDWPANGADPRPFLEAVSSFYSTAKGSPNTLSYGCKHFSRWFVATLDQNSPSGFDPLRYSDVEPYLPDEKEHMQDHFPAVGETTITKLRQTHPLAFWELSMWCCLLAAEPKVQPVMQRLLDKSPNGVLEQCREQEFERQKSADPLVVWPVQLPETLDEWEEHTATREATTDSDRRDGDLC
jgi:hypothetical protein